MAIIDKIKLSGQTFEIQDSNASKTVELTQAEYDALVTKDPNTYYIITDATPIDITNYYTKTQTDDLLDDKLDVTAYTPTDLSNYYTKSETSGATQIQTALASKADSSTVNSLNNVVTAHTASTAIHVTAQDKTNWNNKSDFSGDYNDLTNKLSAGTNITIVDNVISAEGGGSITIDPTLDSGSTNAVANSAITTAINAKANKTDALTAVRVDAKTPTANYTQLNLYSEKNGGGGQTLFTYVKTINGKSVTTQSNSNIEGFSLVETSAITTSVTSTSTDAQVPSAKAVYDKFDEVEQVTAAGLNALNDNFGGLKLVKLTQAQYDALTVKDPNTLYIILG